MPLPNSSFSPRPAPLSSLEEPGHLPPTPTGGQCRRQGNSPCTAQGPSRAKWAGAAREQVPCLHTWAYNFPFLVFLTEPLIGTERTDQDNATLATLNTVLRTCTYKKKKKKQDSRRAHFQCPLKNISGNTEAFERPTRLNVCSTRSTGTLHPQMHAVSRGAPPAPHEGAAL